VQLGLYVHFPFCISKCNYCDFNSQVAPAELRERYLAALIEQLECRVSGLTYCPDGQVSSPTPDALHITTVFFGGGTPTIYSADDLARVLDTISSTGKLDPGAEITCEANPDTVDADKLDALRAAGFNRISLGMQSLVDVELQILGRSHDSDTALAAAATARDIFDNLSVDIIYGIPGQTADSWAGTLAAIIALQPDHISAYGLMIEADTPLFEMVTAGQLQPHDDDTYADLYEQGQSTLAAAGYEQYEISNFARPGRRCLHNLIYWRNQQYLGCGAGAASYLDGTRSVNVADPQEYCDAAAAGEDVIASEETLDKPHWAAETIMLGLRTIEGVDLRQISQDCDIDLEKEHEGTISALAAEGIATYSHSVLRLTPEKGFLLHSEVARRFLL